MELAWIRGNGTRGDNGRGGITADCLALIGDSAIWRVAVRNP